MKKEIDVNMYAHQNPITLFSCNTQSSCTKVIFHYSLDKGQNLLYLVWIVHHSPMKSFQNCQNWSWVHKCGRVPNHSSYDRLEVLKRSRFESGFQICKNFWDSSTNGWDSDFFVPKRRRNSREIDFQVSWFRCHIVRIQGKKKWKFRRNE